MQNRRNLRTNTKIIHIIQVVFPLFNFTKQSFVLCFSFQNSNFHKISESNLRHSTNKFIKFIQIYTKFIQRKFFNPNYKRVDMFLPTGSRDVILNRANTPV